jgi:carboxypeptidase C (cathepsin A)
MNLELLLVKIKQIVHNSSLRMFLLKVIVGLCVIFAALSAYAPDEILSLPGWNGLLPTKQYSGYLNVSSSHLHYLLVLSENNPSTDPVIVWFNGGPGCSSLDGYVYEHGPFEFSRDGTVLTVREGRW